MTLPTDALGALSPLIDHVLDGVYIGGYRAVIYTPVLRAAGVTRVLKLYADLPRFPADFTTLEQPIDDGAFLALPALRRGADFIMDSVRAERPVLVMCSAGISRSATFVLAHLLDRGYDLREAYRLLRRTHREASPHPALWLSLIKHYGLPYTVTDPLDWARDLPED